MDQVVGDFIKNPLKRTKYSDGCPNLGDILVFATLSSKYSM